MKVCVLLCFFSYYFSLGFPGGSDSKESACNAEDRVQSLGQEDPLEKEMATHSSILAGEFHGQRRLPGHSPLGPKSQA